MVGSWTLKMNVITIIFQKLYYCQNRACGKTCFSLSALILLVSFTLHVSPSTSSAYAVTQTHTVGHKWTNSHETASKTDWNRKRLPKRPHRRHLRSRKSGTKFENHKSAGMEILHMGLDDERKDRNVSDVTNTYELEEVPAIWESLRLRNREKVQEKKARVWQRLPTLEDISHFKKLVLQTMTCRKLPALTLALVKEGRVVLRANLGHADPEKHVPVSRNTRFAIGSLTKAFTSTLVSELFLRQNLSLDTAINQLIPDSFELMDEERTRSVTVRDLLSHRTGVPGYFHALLMGFPAHVTRPELVSRLRYIPAVVPLRYQFLYNNYLYTLAANVLEKLTGRPWELLLREVILKPLAMASTGFVDEMEDFSQFALPCALLNGTFKNLVPELLFSVSPCGPAGSLYSTAHDMARWLQVLLSNGKGPEGVQVLQEKALRETTRAVMPPPGIGTDLTRPEFPIGDVEQSYGMGWVTSNYRGYEKVWHSGGIVTYSSRLWLLPGVKAGLFVATNGPQTRDKGHALTAITSMAADLLLGEKFWLNQSTICTFPAPWKPSGSPPPPPSQPTTRTPATSAPQTKKESPSITDQLERTSENVSTRQQNSVDMYPDQLLGVYTHKAFGEIIIERREGGGSDLTGYDFSDPKRSQVDLGLAGIGNASEWLTLKYGRFGQLKLRRMEEGGDRWEGWFVGPLWYVTASDENRSPIHVHFLRDAAGRVDRIRYPIDGQYDDIEFQKRDADVISSVSYSASCGGATVSCVAGMAVGLGISVVLLLTKHLHS